MEGEKDNYRECYSMQEEDKVGDIPVVAVFGVEKGQQAVAETPPSPPLLSSSTPCPTPKPLTHPALLSLSYLCQGPAGTTVYLGGNIVTSGVV